jgi:hypothetical protein
MAFDHTRYKHERGLRSRPRNDAQMHDLFDSLVAANINAETVREVHRRNNYPGRVRELQMARAQIEALMPAVRQEQARNSRDPARKRRYGAELTHLSARARAERRLLMRMLGEWK